MAVLADVWDAVAAAQPSLPAITQADHTVTWASWSARAQRLAAWLINRGLHEQAKVGLYLRNAPEYLEATYACSAAGLVPFNINYRYGREELQYLLANADAEVVVVDAEFLDLVEEVRQSLPDVQHWLVTGSDALPAWATAYEDAVRASAPAMSTDRRHDGQHLMLYTGGTTGLPKGVLWRQDDLVRSLGGVVNPRLLRDDGDLAERVTAGLADVRVAVACPLMHGTGWFTSLGMLLGGGSVHLLQGASYSAEELLDVAANRRATHLVLVGDPFAKPLIVLLEKNPDRWDLSSLVQITSSGVVLSESTKRRLLELLPDVRIVDSLSSAEAVNLGRSVTTRDGGASTFALTDDTIIVDDEGRPVSCTAGAIGKVAIGGLIPDGYYKDPTKSAATFITVEGRRYSCPGDLAQWEADGTITLLGRGSMVINTAGEKVFVEEVEAALKTAAHVLDAAVVGVPDARYGTAVMALVTTDGSAVEEHELRRHVRSSLAGYKVPKRVFVVASLDRGPSGKLDYTELQRRATALTSPQAEKRAPAFPSVSR